MAAVNKYFNSAPVEVGDKCSREGWETCNSDYSTVLTCDNGIYHLKETCEFNSCLIVWDNNKDLAGCFPEPEATEPNGPEVPEIASNSEAQCSPNFKIGASCGTDPEVEGAMRCDDTCSNVGICHDGVFQVNSPCAPGRCQWNADASLPFCV